MFDKNILKRLVKKEVFIEYFKLSIIVIIILTIVNALTAYNMYKTSLSKYEDRLNVINEFNGNDLNLFCNSVTCMRLLVTTNGVVYENKDGVLHKLKDGKNEKDMFKTFFFETFNEKLNTVLTFKQYKLLINDSLYFKNLNIVLLINYVIMFFFITVPYIVFKYEQEKLKDIRDRIASEELEISLQRDLAESLNHEITLPVVMLRNISTEFYLTLTKTLECALSCKFKKDKIPTERLEKLYGGAILAIETIEEVLHTISASKEIKYETRDTSIYEILHTVEASINSINVRNIYVTVRKGKDLSKRYRPCRDLGNGKLGRIFKNHIINSREAKASKVVLTFKLLDNNLMEVFIIDNGLGIQDKNGNIVKDFNRIFKQGITTKKANGDSAGVGSDLSKSRGVGMYINKRELENVGGSVSVVRTSKQGTIFRLVFPVWEIGKAPRVRK